MIHRNRLLPPSFEPSFAGAAPIAAVLVSFMAWGCAEGGEASPSFPDASPDTVLPQPDAAPDSSPDASDASQTDTSIDTADEPDALDEPDAQDEAAFQDVVEESSCPADHKNCNGTCVLITDPLHGCTADSCDPCSFDNATATCTDGACALAGCLNGYGDCNTIPSDGCEVALSTDSLNCGYCDNFCSMPGAQAACESGLCVIASCNPGFDNCDPSSTNGCEANTMLDPSHCGECNHLCQPVGSSACINGLCQTTGCQPGTGDCDNQPDNGCETDVTSAVDNCGFCGNPCVLANATAQCVESRCQIASCNPGFDNCDGEALNGCEAEVLQSILHCGGCHDSCETINNTSRTCESGLCAYLCSPGFADCNGPSAGSSDDGCETVTSSDVNNCGGCSIACVNPHGATECQLSVCRPSCSLGYGNCDDNPTNGCETNINGNEAENCGGCGIECTNPHGDTSCTQGSCNPDCSAGYADCSDPSDGCETQIENDIDNCGDCEAQCINQHGTTVCEDGDCVPTCTGTYKDCNGVPADGCETNTNNDPDHCGTCNNDCTGGAVCIDGECGQTGCEPGTGDCSDTVDGCETDIYNSMLHCGACDNPCVLPNAVEFCSEGDCDIQSCINGFADCNSLDSDGCEINLNSDEAHCGACNAPCSADHNSARECVGGECSYTCNSGFGDCNGPQPGVSDDGCETITSNNPNNCGTCGNTCGSSTGGLCCSGLCRETDPSNCGACNHACVPGYLVINELMINPTLDDQQAEWVELYNPNAYDVDLRGFVLSDPDYAPEAHTIDSELAVIAPAGGYVVLGRNGNPGTNGGVTVDYQYGFYQLGNSGDQVVVTAHGQELDRVEWSGTFDVEGQSQELSVTHRNYTANDTESNWCDATQTYGDGDKGTPGTQNSCP